MTMTGLVLRGIGGFYTVEAADAVYTCRARGGIRRQGIAPVAGDRVEITVIGAQEGSLDRVLERRNSLLRPAVANLDLLIIVAAVSQPAANPLVLDKMIAVAEKQGIDPIVVINKCDLADPTPLETVYRSAGIECYTVSAHDPQTVEPLRRRLAGKISVFTGNSGVGKSSLLNALDPTLLLETGEISRKLGRGRHTTRAATLYRLAGGYIADTPGFSSLDLEAVDPIGREELADCFREFAPYQGKCRFTGCAHYKEPGCAVRLAVEEGRIAPSRYASYVSLYEAVKDKKEWENP